MDAPSRWPGISSSNSTDRPATAKQIATPSANMARSFIFGFIRFSSFLIVLSACDHAVFLYYVITTARKIPRLKKSGCIRNTLPPECNNFRIRGFSNNVVIPTKAEPRRGIFTPNICYADGKCADPSASFHSARDDRFIRMPGIFYFSYSFLF